MKVMVINKETNEEINYSNVIGYDTHAAVFDGEDCEPVFQLIFEHGTATFHKKDWDLFVLKRA